MVRWERMATPSAAQNFRAPWAWLPVFIWGLGLSSGRLGCKDLRNRLATFAGNVASSRRIRRDFIAPSQRIVSAQRWV